jgi:hypothetical protein
LQKQAKRERRKILKATVKREKAWRDAMKSFNLSVK